MPDIQLNAQSLTAGSTSGTTNPATGATETWTVTTIPATIPTLSTAKGETYSMVDPAAPSEIIRVTALTTGGTSATVTRGADGTSTVAHGTGATYNIVVVASAIPRQKLPYYAPGGLLNSFREDQSIYNVKPANMHKVWAAMEKLAQGTASMHVGFFGDSTLIGYNGASYIYKNSIPYRFGQTLAKRLGTPYHTTGVQQPTTAVGSVGDRWTLLTGGFSTGLASDAQLLSSSSAGTATWVSPDQCTNIDFFVSNLTTTGQLTYQVDGGTASSTITTTGAGTVQKVSITGLTNGIHTLKLTSASGSTFILGARPFISGQAQLHIHNLAIGGAKANTSGTAGLNYSDVTTTGLGNSTQLTMTASGVTMDLMVISLGNNDIFAGTSAANTITGLTALRNYFSGVPCVFIHPPMVTGSTQSVFDTLSGSFFTMCDTLDTGLLDWNDLAQGQPTYLADGLAGADNLHPTDAEQFRIGSHLANALCRQQFDNVSSAGNSYRLVEAAGVYPPRPNVPAGYVNYTGPDQPTDWLDGDTWDDLP